MQQVTETMDKSLAQPYNRTTAFLEKKKKKKGGKKKEVLKIVEANSKSKATQRRLAEAKELFGKENHRKIWRECDNDERSKKMLHSLLFFFFSSDVQPRELCWGPLSFRIVYWMEDLLATEKQQMHVMEKLANDISFIGFEMEGKRP